MNNLNLEIVKLLHPNQGDAWYEAYLGAGNFAWQDWSKLMPLVVEHGVSFLNYQVEYQATNGEYNGCEAWTKENPQRMLAECLLKVLQEKQGDE